MSPDDLDLAPGGGQHRPRLLTIMGSGETAPPMAKVHRLLVERLGPPPVDVVLLDTPYGFQENTDQISQRAVGLLRAEPPGDTPRRKMALGHR